MEYSSSRTSQLTLTLRLKGMQKPGRHHKQPSWQHIKLANTLIGVFWQYSWQCPAVKDFLPFLQGVPAQNTELHRALTRWLVGNTQVFICPSHDHMLSKWTDYETMGPWAWTCKRAPFPRFGPNLVPSQNITEM